MTTTHLMPALFIGHGNPMNAIEETVYAAAWREEAASIPRPKTILCISAHWETEGSFVTAMRQPKTIHDFYGFPDELNKVQYPAPGPDQRALSAAVIRSCPAAAERAGFILRRGVAARVDIDALGQDRINHHSKSSPLC